jgi:hypothetical protein
MVIRGWSLSLPRRCDAAPMADTPLMIRSLSPHAAAPLSWTSGGPCQEHLSSDPIPQPGLIQSRKGGKDECDPMLANSDQHRCIDGLVGLSAAAESARTGTASYSTQSTRATRTHCRPSLTSRWKPPIRETHGRVQILLDRLYPVPRARTCNSRCRT